MARKTIQSLVAEKIAELKNKGETVDGYLLGHSDKQTQFGLSRLFILCTSDGSKIGVWGSTILNGFMASVKQGQHVWITYNGKTKSSKGNLVKQFTVDVDDEDVIDVGLVSDNSTSQLSSDEDSDAPSYDDEDTELDIVDVSKTRSPSKTLPSKDKVSQLLRSRA